MSANRQLSYDKANIMRLRINRVNIIQTIETPQILVKLLNLKVINMNELDHINTGSTRQDKARNLIDCLITKKHTQADWYVKFRNALQECSYRDLAVFLDNTILSQIHQGPSKTTSTVSHSNPAMDNNIGAKMSQKFTDPDNMMQLYNEVDGDHLINSDYNQLSVPPTNSHGPVDHSDSVDSNLKLFSMKPNALIELLAKSTDPDDLKQIDDEMDAYSAMMKLESLYLMYINGGQMFGKHLFLDTDVASSVIKSTKFHFCIKYFKHLQEAYSIDLLKYLSDTLMKLFRHTNHAHTPYKNFENTYDLVSRLSSMFRTFESHVLALNTLTEFLNTLPVHNQDGNIQLWKLKFDCGCLLLMTFADILDFDNSYKVFNATSKVLFCIKSSAPGLKVECVEFFYGISKITYEEGSFQAAFDWINKALLEIHDEHPMIIDVLILAASCYASKWSLLKTKMVIMLAIQVAKSKYGKNDPNFIKAILSYINFCNEYFQCDEQVLFLSKYILSHANKVYGFDSIIVADVNECQARTLMKFNNYDDDIYLMSAEEAFKIASTIYLNDSPKLVKYKITLILAYQTKGANSISMEMKRFYFENALELCLIIFRKTVELFGEINFRTAQACLLCASVFASMLRNVEAESMFAKALETLEVVMPKDSVDILLAKIQFSIFLKTLGRHAECMELLKTATEKIDLRAYGHIPLIRLAYDTLMEYYKSVHNLSAVKFYENILKYDESAKSKNIDIIGLINSSPPNDFKNYISSLIV